MVTATARRLRYFCAKARPAPSGICAPTMPLPPKKLAERRYMCIEPPRPCVAPVALPMSSAMTSNTVPPRVMCWQWSRYDVTTQSSMLSASSMPDITASWPS